ncbi:MAG TPA: class I SAM-dependent methyltransferase [Gemmatimonadales bacterium]|jgi:ubiquinone/menaquinone biosynthesis C-methylase UbiE|nr:class I SAM-dependent methyltransferase [Gemmatimonadales bacterium]
MSTDAQRHWNAIYGGTRAEELSWFQAHDRMSMELTRLGVPDHAAQILDVGGGASTFVDDLLAEGYRRVTVLDLAPTGLAVARERLGAAANQVSWVEADVLSAPFEAASVDLWHDRAVFHFLTAPNQRAQYVNQVRWAVRPGGYVLVATFASDGPPRCSGLPVARYDPEELHRVFGAGFELVASRREIHRTPRGVPQSFTYCLCRFDGSDKRSDG